MPENQSGVINQEKIIQAWAIVSPKLGEVTEKLLKDKNSILTKCLAQIPEEELSSALKSLDN